MKNLRRSAFVLSLFASVVWSQVSFAGFVEGTKVSAAAGALPIELLQAGDYVATHVADARVSFETWPEAAPQDERKITQITNLGLMYFKSESALHSARPEEAMSLRMAVSKDTSATTKIIGTYAEKQNNVVVIRTALGTICSSPEQLFYDVTRDNFVPACELNLRSLLVTRSLTQHRCEAVELFAIPAVMHELSLEEPHVFFVGQGEFLTHNAYAPAVGAAVLGFAIAPLPVVLAAGTVLAVVAFNAATPKILGKAITAKTEIEKESERFVNKLRSNPNTLARREQREPQKQAPPPLFDVFIDSNRYLDLIKSPAYGQIYAALNVNPDCEVNCQLFVQRLKEIDYRTNKLFFDWVALGEAKLPYHNPLSKAALAEEDSARMAELREYVKSLPLSVTKRLFNPRVSVEVEAEGIKLEEGCFDGRLYQKVFGPHAICKIVRQNIPPSAIICALKQGTRKQAKRDGLLICFDQKLNVALVLDKVSGKVINLGTYSEMNALDQEKRKTKTVEQIVGEARPQIGGKRGGPSEIYIKPGGFDVALEDFHSLGLSGVRDTGVGKTGLLADGRRVNVRWKSGKQDKPGPPTLDIEKAPGSYEKIKIRYCS